MKTKKHLIVALDKITKEQALEIAKSLSDYVWGFKFNDLLLREGVKIISEFSKFTNVFADPKLYDIPNTAANSVKVLEESGAKIITLHASGGKEMLEAAKDSSASAKLLAVTLLTSFEHSAIKHIYQDDFTNTLTRLVSLATESKMDGIVCSGNELELINSLTKSDFIKLTPGIRPIPAEDLTKHKTIEFKDDQKRTMTPKDALSLGSSYLVVGRPIIESKDPVKAVLQINEDLK